MTNPITPQLGERAAQVPVEPSQPDNVVERMKSGDLDAFEEFFNSFKRPIYATALAITRDPFPAEEVLQDCFVKAHRVRERRDGGASRAGAAGGGGPAAALATTRDDQPVLQPREPASDAGRTHRQPDHQ